jgi:hypothetical protein
MIRQLGRAQLEVADILRTHGDEFRRLRNPSARQRKILRNIEQCRTAALGGHKDTCTNCGHVRVSYNSCRDRHCPKCQSLKKDEWLEARKQRLLPVPYFHVVFTLPNELNPLALRNKKIVFDLLFKSAAETLQQVASQKKHLGAQIGFTAVLHTWGQKLQFHPHLHCVVTGGGLDFRQGRWIAASQRYFLCVDVLGMLFKAKFLEALKTAHTERKLSLAGTTAHLEDRRLWQRLLNRLYSSKWVVYAKPPFGGPEHVFRYLGRYTHRVAISNHRLLELKDGQVTFRIKDYADEGKSKSLTISAVEFIRRFLLHVLPERFVRIRHYGLMAGRNVETKLARAREILGVAAKEDKASPGDEADASKPWWERLFELTGVDIFQCPVCGSGRMLREPLQPVPLPAHAAWDTS